MAQKPKKPQSGGESSTLRGWREIASFLGQPISVLQRWARAGLPVEHKGRSVYASPKALNRWLEREAAEPVQIANEGTDLTTELKRGLTYARKPSANRKTGKAA